MASDSKLGAPWFAMVTVLATAIAWFAMGFGIGQRAGLRGVDEAIALSEEATAELKHCTATMQRHDREWKAAADQCLLLVDLARASCR